jgi:indole-3-glycerol phosphate synthase
MLEKIIATKRAELPALRARRLPAPPGLRPFDLARGARGRLSLIAEIKRRSPSAGALSRALSVGERARAYERGGADLISVLCDQSYFDGAYEHLLEARASSGLPLLCKEFVIDEAQLDAARAYGAELVLLIVRCLTPPQLERLLLAAHERGLECLVEVHAPSEVATALAAGSRIVGVNARDLETLEVDYEQANGVLSSLPDEVVKLHLSGLHTPEQVAGVARSGADGALIGESLMRQDDPEPLLRRFVAAAKAS